MIQDRSQIYGFSQLAPPMNEEQKSVRSASVGIPAGVHELQGNVNNSLIIQ